MIHAQVLPLPDFDKPFLLQTDASGSGMGDCPTSRRTPDFLFLVKTFVLNSRILHLCSLIHAITCAVKKWRHYLLGRLQ